MRRLPALAEPGVSTNGSGTTPGAPPGTLPQPVGHVVLGELRSLVGVGRVLATADAAPGTGRELVGAVVAVAGVDAVVATRLALADATRLPALGPLPWPWRPRAVSSCPACSASRTCTGSERRPVWPAKALFFLRSSFFLAIATLVAAVGAAVAGVTSRGGAESGDSEARQRALRVLYARHVPWSDVPCAAGTAPRSMGRSTQAAGLRSVGITRRDFLTMAYPIGASD